MCFSTVSALTHSFWLSSIAHHVLRMHNLHMIYVFKHQKKLSSSIYISCHFYSCFFFFSYLIEGLPTMPALNPLLICRTIITLSPGNKEDFKFGMESGDQSVQRMDGLLFYFFTGSCLSICSCWFFCSAVPAVDQWTKTELLCKSSEQEIDSRLFEGNY